jgi:hypothetical protein
LAVVVDLGHPLPPDAPDELTPTQAEIWRRIVSSENVDFFRSAAAKGLLIDYCRHRDAAAGISEIINSFKPEWLRSEDGCARYATLLKMREMEVREAGAMARALRLTNQSRYRPETAARRDVYNGPRPWE